MFLMEMYEISGKEREFMLHLDFRSGFVRES